MTDAIYEVVRRRAAAEKAADQARRSIDMRVRDTHSEPDTLRASRQHAGAGKEVFQRMGETRPPN
jgi:hypothetical protein